MATPSVQAVLKSQYHASLAMLHDVIGRCPDDLWLDKTHKNAFWQISYHVLFYTHLYLHDSEGSFQPWPQHQHNVQYPGGLPGRASGDLRLPEFPDPYSKAQVLEFWLICDDLVDPAVDGFDLTRDECGFWWYPMSKLEHQVVNIRHIQHHTAQLIGRLRAATDVGIRWVGAGPAAP